MFDDSLMHVCECFALVRSVGNSKVVHLLDMHFYMIIFQTASVAMGGNKLDQRLEKRSGKKSEAERELTGFPLLLSQYTEAYRNHTHNTMEVSTTHTHKQMTFFYAAPKPTQIHKQTTERTKHSLKQT